MYCVLHSFSFSSFYITPLFSDNDITFSSAWNRGYVKSSKNPKNMCIPLQMHWIWIATVSQLDFLGFGGDFVGNIWEMWEGEGWTVLEWFWAAISCVANLYYIKWAAQIKPPDYLSYLKICGVNKVEKKSSLYFSLSCETSFFRFQSCSK